VRDGKFIDVIDNVSLAELKSAQKQQHRSIASERAHVKELPRTGLTINRQQFLPLTLKWVYRLLAEHSCLARCILSFNRADRFFANNIYSCCESRLTRRKHFYIKYMVKVLNKISILQEQMTEKNLYSKKMSNAEQC
jgi:hypothetical protein